ncbi:MAG: carbon-nitrogen hydrolase family protein [Nitrososphaerales archaeon]
MATVLSSAESETASGNRTIRLAAIQCAPADSNKDSNIQRLLQLVDRAAEEGPDYILLNELSTTQYFCDKISEENFGFAETIPGPTTRLFAEKARKHSCTIILPMFEKGSVEGEYYNSAVIIDQRGSVVQGTLPEGEKVHCYRKVHIPSRLSAPYCHEKVYFKSGQGFPIFSINNVNIGVIICFDRSFPESWRVLALQGAEIVFLPMAGSGWRSELFEVELRTRAFENGIFIVAANKIGTEQVGDSKRDFFGKSVVVDPLGSVLAKSKDAGSDEIIVSDIDLKQVSSARLKFAYLRDRHPEKYGLITRP